jgi:molecular chaperone GrpE
MSKRKKHDGEERSMDTETPSYEESDDGQDAEADTVDVGPNSMREAEQGDHAQDTEQESSDAESAEASEEDRISQLEARIRELEQENSELKDQYLRKQADFENFRKRMRKEKEEAATQSNRDLLLDIVGIIDDFERAIRSGEESRDFDSFHDGIALIEKQFTGMLERKWGLRRFDSEGEEFDPQKHEALATEEDPNYEHSVVLEDYQKGYYLDDKVLRSAKVKVSVPPQSSGDQEAEGKEATSEEQSDDS